MRLLGTLVVVVGVVLVVGLFFDWWSFSKTDTGNGTNVSFQVNEDKLDADTAKAKRKIEGLADDDEADEVDRLEGRLVAVDLNNRSITVLPTTGGEVMFSVRDDTQIHLAGREVDLSNLEPGQRVVVHYAHRAGGKDATRIESNRSD
jgi:cold shock CspA family protein